MKSSEEVETIDQGRAVQRESSQARAAGSPLPAGGSGRGWFSSMGKHSGPPPGRTLTNPEASADISSTQRAMNLLKMAVPLVQKVLPLLDGNFGTAISNLVAPSLLKQPPKVTVNLEPIEHGLTQLQEQHRDLVVQNRDLREQLVEQNANLKRVEDQLEMVREATDRNTLEQQELMEDLKAVGAKVNLVAITALGMLAISLLLNLFLYLHIQRVLP